MKTSKHNNPETTVKTKYLDCENFMDRLWKQVSPRSKLSTLNSPIINNQSNKKTTGSIFKSTRFTSPNSCQSSELVSRKASREKEKISKNLDDKIKKKRKRKVSSHCDNEEKENNSNKINSEVSEQFKITRWKNKVLKEFVLKQYQHKQNCCLNFLEQSLKLYQSEESFKSSKENSVLAHLAGEKEEAINKPTLTGVSRVVTIDWMYLISTSLLLNRETIHLAIHYLDNFLLGVEGPCENLHIIAAAAMLLSVKQEERESQSALLATVCMSEQFSILKDQVIECEKAILTKLNFRLKSNTLAFWIDYFSSKWDLFIESNDGLAAMKEANIHKKLKLRSSDGESYRLYRELMELSDVMLMFSEYTQFNKSKLALACIYLVVRIEWERLLKGKNEDEELFKVYHKEFLKKASPIFKDPFRVNEILNSFLTEMCDFEITEIIPPIKLVANFLNVDFCYNVDEKAIEEVHFSIFRQNHMKIL